MPKSDKSEHFDKWLRPLLKTSGLSTTARLLLMVLNSHAKDLEFLESHHQEALAANGLAIKGIRACFPSIETLALEVGITPSNIKKQLKVLVDQKWIRKIERAGGKADQRNDRRPNLYALGLPLRGIASDPSLVDNGVSPATSRNGERGIGASSHGVSPATPKETTEETNPLSQENNSEKEKDLSQHEEAILGVVGLTKVSLNERERSQLREAAQRSITFGLTLEAVTQAAHLWKQSGKKYPLTINALTKADNLATIKRQYEASQPKTSPRVETARCEFCNSTGWRNETSPAEKCDHSPPGTHLRLLESDPQQDLEAASALQRNAASQIKAIKESLEKRNENASKATQNREAQSL
jgi:DNA-binding MarR family transcriptional regulator